MNILSSAVIVEPLPPHPEAAKDFLRVQRETSINTYTGLPCLTQDNEPSSITEKDMVAFFDPTDPQVVDYLVKMAETNFDPKRQLGSVLLRAVDLDQGRRTIGTLNLKFGAVVTPDNPASVTLHDIAVRRDSQRRGVGTLMLGAALTAIGPHQDASDLLRLTVVSTNEPAKAWYDKLGIYPTGHIKNSEWGKRAIKVTLEERSSLIGELAEKIAVARP